MSSLHISVPIALIAVFVVLLPLAKGHSQMSWPQSTAPMTCRMGGEARAGVHNCAGPCDLTAIKGRYCNYDSPSKPAAVYRRGQRVTVKYQRNNHAPGGFERLTLVPVAKMMDKRIHERNAFFYSCWGAKTKVASAADRKKDKFGFSITGNDGTEHGHAPAFYETHITIPACVGDGDYVLGWVWYGGIGAPVEGNHPTKPKEWGFFADYWSCAYVRVQGGVPIQQKCKVTFDNDMNQFSSAGCMAANDHPGVCTWEPCKRNGHFQKPKPFKGGRQPYIYSWQFPHRPRGGSSSMVRPMPPHKPKPTQKPAPKKMTVSIQARNACQCLAKGHRCSWKMAKMSGWKCRWHVGRWRQWRQCRNACCSYCSRRNVRRSEGVCWQRNVRKLCKWAW